MQTIRPFLWFDDQAQEAAAFYTSVFEDGKIEQSSEMSVSFSLRGMRFIAFNGGPQFTFSPAISFFVNCETQDEIDELWTKLSAGGETLQCGWLRDKFGVTWQIVPSVLGDLLGDEDEAKAERVRDAMLQMVKLDIAELQRAYDAVG
ncbi:MAG TPA: VOC family protein [Candidatus Limnocylindria bacterium]|jgi:predicted 3-demethylubiquinone-9 3-methyltransferase (glyoxalase superfamily)|nr:VOC family protein [Candidatus Limnocylindria bacterium]